jgi:peptide-methionine (S)-S-oxide reductase
MNTSSDSNNDDNINTNNNMVAISKTLALGAGCYWGTEKYVVKDFQKLFPNSIAKAEVGFMSPDPNAPVNPSYRAVCSGTTTHVEVLQVELNEPSKHLEELIKFFFMFHDPTTKNRQGNDVGTQYASAIFCSDSAQKETVQRVKEELQKLVDAGKVKYSGKKIETDVFDMHPFYAAHEEHQAYLEKNPGGYCNHYMRFKEWPTATSMN